MGISFGDLRLTVETNPAPLLIVAGGIPQSKTGGACMRG
jgi:hypothetical protein